MTILLIKLKKDFCIYGPKDAEKPIGDTEAEQVAWCTQPRNNARLIPEGTFTGKVYIQLKVVD